MLFRSVWDELHNSVRFCSTVVSRRMTFEHAYKLASETLLAHLTFAENLCNSEHAAHIWRIRFCDNKRFATIDDLNNYCVHTSNVDAQDTSITVKLQKEAQKICEDISQGYKITGLACPQLEMIPYHVSGESPIDWLILKYEPK